jgi:hypothetical protein
MSETKYVIWYANDNDRDETYKTYSNQDEAKLAFDGLKSDEDYNRDMRLEKITIIDGITQNETELIETYLNEE